MCVLECADVVPGDRLTLQMRPRVDLVSTDERSVDLSWQCHQLQVWIHEVAAGMVSAAALDLA